MAETEVLHRFTVGDYERMVEAGILTIEDKVELIDGRIVAMSPMGVPHAAVVSCLQHLLMPLADRVIFRVQLPIVLGDHSEPEPDLVLAATGQGFYRSRHPRAGDIHLVIEVSESSARFDREVKGPLYARSGIREYWLVDLAAEAIEVYRDPGDEGYATQSVVARGGRLTHEAFPEVSIALDDVLG